MQRITISADIENNKLFEKEIEKAIEGVIKSKTRDLFEQQANEELQRVIDDRIKKWSKEKGYYFGDKSLHQIVVDTVDKKIRTELDSLSIDRDDFYKALDSYIAKYINEDSVKRYIDRLVKESVKDSVSAEILKLLAASLGGNREG